MTKAYKATNNFLVIKNELRGEQKTAGGLVRKLENKEAKNDGIVLSVGPDVKHVKVGDKIWFNKVQGLVGDDKPQLVVVSEENVMCIESEGTY